MSQRQKKSADATSDGVALETTPTSSISGLLAAAADTVVDADVEEVKVNNASVTEMKHACDDALKRVSVFPLFFPRVLSYQAIST